MPGIVGEGERVSDLDRRDVGAGQQPQVARCLHNGLQAVAVLQLYQH